MKLAATIVCLLGLTAFTAGADPAANKIEGTWNLTGVISKGEKAPAAEIAKAMGVAVFKDGKYSLSTGGKQMEAGTYKADASKTPATIDVVITEGKDKDKTQLGIFKIDGDKLTIAMSSPGSKDRPKSFEGGAKEEVTMLTRKK